MFRGVTCCKGEDKWCELAGFILAFIKERDKCEDDLNPGLEFVQIQVSSNVGAVRAFSYGIHLISYF